MTKIVAFLIVEKYIFITTGRHIKIGLTGLFFGILKFRLCSNIISHIRSSIIPSLLDEGAQKIKQFLDNEFTSNVNNDQAKVR